jgi:hypothetical protein
MRVLLLLVTGLGLSNGGMDVDCINQPADPSCGEPAAPRPHSMATRTEPLPDAFRRFVVAGSFQLNASQCIAGIKMNCDMSGGLSMLSSHAALQSACHRMAASNRHLCRTVRPNLCTMGETIMPSCSVWALCQKVLHLASASVRASPHRRCRRVCGRLTT